MYQNNRNLFPVFAVLLAAGLITGVCSIFLILVDQLGGGSKVIARADAETTLVDSPSTPKNNTSESFSTETLGAHTDTVLKVATQTTASGTPLIASGSYDTTVKLWNSEVSDEAMSLAQNGRVNALVFMPNRESLVTGSGSGDIKFWNVATGESTATIAGQSGRIVSLASDAASTHIASGSSNGTIKVWPLTTNGASVKVSEAKELVSVGAQINTLAFHPTNSQILVSGDHDGVIQVWDLSKEEPILTLDGDIDRILGLSISRDGKYVASGSYDKIIQIWDLESGAMVQTLEGHDFVVADVAFSPDGNTLASSSYDESIKMWDWTNAKELCTLSGHSGFVYTVAFANEGNALVSGGYDGTVRTWDLTEQNYESCLLR